MRKVQQEASFHLTITSDPLEVPRIQDHIEGQLKEHHFEDRDIFSIRLALEEALVNAIKHGNQLDRAKKVHIDCAIYPARAADRDGLGVIGVRFAVAVRRAHEGQGSRSHRRRVGQCPVRE